MHTSVTHRTPKIATLTRPAPAGRKAPMTLPELMEQAQRLQATGQAEAAEMLYADWIEHDTTLLRCPALFNRGSLLGQLGRTAEAADCYIRALQIKPDFAPAWLNLGHHREREGRHDDALICWKEVYDGIASGPATALEHRLHGMNQAARLLEQLKRLAEAEALMRRSLELQPEQLDVIQHYVSVRQKQCQWPAQRPPGQVTPNLMLLGTSAMSTMGLHDDPALQLLAAMRFVHARVPKAAAVPMHTLTPPRSGRIRIGYLSGDLHHHAVGLLTAELFELHDRSRFEIHGFCWTPDSASPQRQRILKALDQHTRLAGVDDHTAARLIAQAGIDVLVDLQGLTSGARPAILGRRAAPVQVAWLGLPGTSAGPARTTCAPGGSAASPRTRASGTRPPAGCASASRSCTDWVCFTVTRSGPAWRSATVIAFEQTTRIDVFTARNAIVPSWLLQTMMYGCTTSSVPSMRSSAGSRTRAHTSAPERVDPAYSCRTAPVPTSSSSHVNASAFCTGVHLRPTTPITCSVSQRTIALCERIACMLPPEFAQSGCACTSQSSCAMCRAELLDAAPAVDWPMRCQTGVVPAEKRFCI